MARATIITTVVAWGDFDGDGDLDLAVGNGSQQNVVYPNNGDGTFGAGVDFGTGSDGPFTLAWGDADNDGDLDLAVGATMVGAMSTTMSSGPN